MTADGRRAESRKNSDDPSEKGLSRKASWVERIFTKTPPGKTRISTMPLKGQRFSLPDETKRPVSTVSSEVDTLSVDAPRQPQLLGQKSQSMWEQEKIERELSMMFLNAKKKRGPLAFYGRVRLWAWRQLHASKGGILWDAVQTALSIIACVLYVVETYTGEKEWILIIDGCTSSVFAMDYVMNLFAAKNPIFFVLSPMAMIDVLTIVPIYIRIIFDASLSKLSFFRVFRILRLLRLLRALRIFKASKLLKRMGTLNEKWASNMRLLFGILCGLFAFAAIMQQLESGESDMAAEEWQFHNAIYYVVVTVSTVGYGDMSPATTLGRAMCCVIIVVTLIFVPLQLARISDIVFEQLQHKYKNPYRVKETHDHVIVLGSVSQQGLMDFITEFFHVDHLGNRTKMVLLLPEMPADHVKQLLANPDYEDRLHYIRGSALVEEDMQRAAAEQASAVFIFADKHENPRGEDVANILRTLAFRHYGEKSSKDINSNTFIQINLVESKDKLISTGVQRSRVVCIEELQMAMFALGALYPGAQAFVGNLLRSYTTPPSISDHSFWFRDYSRGCEYEVYKIRLPDTFRKKTFTEMVIHSYLEYNIFLFAVEVEVPGGFRVVLNPGNTLDCNRLTWPRNGLYGFVLAQDIRETMAMQFEGQLGILSPGGGYEKNSETMQNLKSKPRLMQAMVSHRSQVSLGSRRKSSAAKGGQNDEFDGEEDSAVLEEDDMEEVLARVDSSDQYLRSSDAICDRLKSQQFGTGGKGGDDMVDFDVGIDIIRPKWASGQVESLVRAEKGEPLVRGHIIVTGTWRSQDRLVEMLRVHYRLQRPVVLLNPDKPNDVLWKRLMSFRNVYFVQGSAGQYEDLDRVSIYSAHSVVVFRNEKNDKEMKSEAHLADADTVLSVLTIRNAIAKNPSLSKKSNGGWMPMVCEFAFSSNVQYVEPKALLPTYKKNLFGKPRAIFDEEMLKTTNRPMYASGSVFLFSILDSLLCQSYFSRRLLLVLQELVGNEPHSDRLKSIGVKKSRFYQISLPKEYVGFTFKELMVCFMRDFQTMCVGLYRFDQVGDLEPDQELSPAPYVVTCPRRETILRSNDKLFVLSQNIRVIKTKYNI